MSSNAPIYPPNLTHEKIYMDGVISKHQKSKMSSNAGYHHYLKIKSKLAKQCRLPIWNLKLNFQNFELKIGFFTTERHDVTEN